MKSENLAETEKLNEVAPLVAAIAGALIGAGLTRAQAQSAAQAAVQDPAVAQAAGTQTTQGSDYNQTLRRGSRGEGVRQLQQNLGMQQADGIFGPNTEAAVRRFQQSQNLQVDGVVGPETRARIARMAGDDDGETRSAAPATSPRPQARPTGDPAVDVAADDAARRTVSASKQNTGNPLKEEVTISGPAEELIRMMQLAGAEGAKAVDTGDINSGPKPCPMCGKIHGPMSSPGGCATPQATEPDMGDMIRMISAEEIANEKTDDGDFSDASTEPDEVYMNDVSASIPNGDDLHKKKRSHKPVAGGDNPMALETQLRTKLAASLSEKMKSR